MTSDKRPYRDGVVGVFEREDGCVLVFERSDIKGQFQFPQGGIDEGESPEVCLKREVYEETGCAAFAISAKGKSPVVYDFPADLPARIAKKYRGQRQWWFKLKLSGSAMPDLNKAPDNEFVSYNWCRPADAIAGIAAWRKQSYIDGLSQLGLWPEGSLRP